MTPALKKTQPCAIQPITFGKELSFCLIHRVQMFSSKKHQSRTLTRGPFKALNLLRQGSDHIETFQADFQLASKSKSSGGRSLGSIYEIT